MSGKNKYSEETGLELIRSSRKTLSLEIKPDGRVIVRAPLRMSQRKIDGFVENKAGWIEKHLSRLKTAQAAQNGINKLTDDELQLLAEKALQYIPQRVEYYSKLIGVNYGRITIRNQRTKWGSCSSKGNLNFNCLLMLTPPEVIDSVVVHELCHRKEMNHSDRFYAEVMKVYPEYKKWNRWLKENGPAIMSRAHYGKQDALL
ncbi:MAG: M48 family metallopeptidase [Eubacterium sp.]|nr:M48 family metallopeptidase [Eubacterium sp.]